MRWTRSLAGLAASMLFAAPSQALIVADGADDVCSLVADPCVVTDTVEVKPDSTLDFGPRALVVEGNGKIEFGSGSSDILAGSVILGGKGVLADADGSGGFISVVARRGCSLEAGAACRADGDCDFGICGPASTCAQDEARECSSNADCNVGTCSLGQGTLALTALWDARTASPGGVLLSAADDLTVSATMDASGSGNDANGGFINLESTFGNVNVGGAISVSGGIDGYGGEFTADAGGSVSLNAPIDCTGGDSDAGEVTVFAGTDVTVTGDIVCTAIGGYGSGGYLDLNAERDILLTGGGSADRMLLEAFGHRSADNFGGDGGEIGLYAGRHIVVGQWVRILSAGAAPDGAGGDLTLDAGSDFSLEGEVETRADGIDGDGGYLDIAAGGDVTVAATALLSVDGGSVGYLDIEAAGDVDLDGAITMIGRQGGIGGGFSLLSGGDATIRGDLTSDKEDNEVEIEACRIDFEDGSLFNNNSANGTNVLIAHESIRVKSGATLKTKSIGVNAGTNTFFYRAADKPPVVLGTVSPNAVLTLSPDLPGCPVCGNGEIDQGETCDDGDTVADNSCTDDCQLAACADATVGGYPSNELCNDDVDCTVDACSRGTGACTHTADSSACDDDDTCTIDSCSLTQGCLHAPTVGEGCPGICGDGNGNGLIQASDALVALKAAVGSLQCALPLCDVNNNGLVQASDALAILRKAVGQPVILNCPTA